MPKGGGVSNSVKQLQDLQTQQQQRAKQMQAASDRANQQDSIMAAKRANMGLLSNILTGPLGNKNTKLGS